MNSSRSNSFCNQENEILFFLEISLHIRFLLPLIIIRYYAKSTGRIYN